MRNGVSEGDVGILGLLFSVGVVGFCCIRKVLNNGCGVAFSWCGMLDLARRWGGVLCFSSGGGNVVLWIWRSSWRWGLVLVCCSFFSIWLSMGWVFAWAAF
jgi:hypothetical protein